MKRTHPHPRELGATRFFARLIAFDLECPRCGKVFQIRRHAEKVYGEALSKIAINLLQYPKYVGLQAALEATLDAGIFAELQALRSDLTLEPGEVES